MRARFAIVPGVLSALLASSAFAEPPRGTLPGTRVSAQELDRRPGAAAPALTIPRTHAEPLLAPPPATVEPTALLPGLRRETFEAATGGVAASPTPPTPAIGHAFHLRIDSPVTDVLSPHHNLAEIGRGTNRR